MKKRPIRQQTEPQPQPQPQSQLPFSHLHPHSRSHSQSTQKSTQTYHGLQFQQISSESRHEELQIQKQRWDDRNKLNNSNGSVGDTEERSPLAFCCRIGDNYLFSFKRKQAIGFAVRFICLSIFVIFIQLFVMVMTTTTKQFKSGLQILSALNLLSFLLLFYLDPGTVVQDEQQKMNEQRVYCRTCKLYRSENSHHCVFCRRCVRGYDHHCGFFGKCIGRNNIGVFYFFMVSSSLVAFGSFGSLFYTIFAGAADIKK